MAIRSTVCFDELNLDEALAENQFDFDSWTILISHVENKYSNDIHKLSSVYDPFLSEFPLCCGYWSKFAAHKARLCSVEDVVEVYEKAIEAASFSVDIWLDYCTFAITVFEDPFDVTRLFRRGLSYIGKDYLCHALWDKYIEFEFSQKQWCSLSQIYIEALKFPTKKLHQYYDSFIKLVTIWEEDIGCHGDSIVKLQPETQLYEELTAPENDEVSFVISDLLESSTRSEALKKYLYIGEHLYQRASRLDKKICCFEKGIIRTYFHVNTLDNDQLENWHRYLDFVQMTGDFDWAVKLYERCLIPCASYSEFWMRYVEYVESKGGREIAYDALQRATQSFLKDLPAIHLFSAGYKEQIGDFCGARAAILHIDVHSESSFVDCVMRRANMEKRLGNNVAAFNIYKEALSVANKEMPNTLPILYIQFSRLQFMATNSIVASRDILIDGVQNVVNCKLLLEEIIFLALNHEAARQISILDPIVADVIMPDSDVSRGLSYKDKLDISELYLKFIDLCGNIHDSRKAWHRHFKSFPRSLRADPTSMQPVCASSLGKILSDGSQGTTCINQKEVTRTDETNFLIQPSEDNTENMKDHFDEDDTFKKDDEDWKSVCRVSGIELMEDEKNDGICDIQKEQLNSSGGDDSPLVDILSLDEPENEPHNLGAAVDHGCNSNQEATPSKSMSKWEQDTELQTRSFLSKADVTSSGQEYCESPTPSHSNLQTLKAQMEPDSHHSPMKYADSQKHKAPSLSSPHHRSEQSPAPSPREPFSSDEKGIQSCPDRHRQNRPLYYDNSRGQRVRRLQSERRGASGYARRARYNHPQRPAATSQIHPPAQPGFHPSGHMGHYPMQQQSNEQNANMQSSQAYNQMWQYYYYYQQQQQLALLQQQSYSNLPQQQGIVQSQAQLQSQEESQANQMQQALLFQQMQLQYQQVQQEEVGQQAQTQQQEVAQQDVAQQIQLQQQQIQAYQYQQQYLLYLQQLQQQQQPGGTSQTEQPKEEHSELQLQPKAE